MSLSGQDYEALLRTVQASTDLTREYMTDTSNNSARIKALTAVKNLLFELQNGDDAFFYRMEQVAAAVVLHFLIKLGALEATPIEGSIAASDLAAKLECDASFIIRLMRLCVAAGTFEEIEQDVYAHTKRSRNLLDPGYWEFFSIMMDDFYASGCFPRLSEYFSQHPKRSPDDPRHNVYTHTQDMDGRDWHEVFARTPERLQSVNVAFSGRWSHVPVFGAYPFERLGDAAREDEGTGRALIVDVGGAIGATMKELKESLPELESHQSKIVVQDQERVIRSIPEGFLPEGIETMVYDFFTPQPIQGARVYYLRRVLHDWPDYYASQILRQQVDAMAEDSIVLLADMVVPERVQRDDTYVYWMDLTMFMFAGKERSASDWRELLDASGLELTRVWEPAIGTQCVVEGRKKRS